jgi:Ribbon-helix-helix protein, copG family
MSKRLQVLIPDEMDPALQKAAKRARVSKGEWVRRAIEQALRQDREGLRGGAVERLAQIGAPTADIEDMLAEIDAARGGGE